MADLDAFETANNAEVDPAAEFLAREQSELAGLEDDNFTEPQQSNDQEFDAFAQPSGAEDVSSQQNNTDDEIGDFEMLGKNEGAGFDGAPVENGGLGEDFGELSTNGPSNIYEAISQQDTVRAEPEKIRIWREEQKARLEKKDEEEEKRKKELKEVAKKELDDWYKHHAEQLEKTKENNRASESAFVKDRDETIPGQAWEKITRLCEFNPKNSKTSKDVSRLRSILLQLKQTPLVR